MPPPPVAPPVSVVVGPVVAVALPPVAPPVAAVDDPPEPELEDPVEVAPVPPDAACCELRSTVPLHRTRQAREVNAIARELFDKCQGMLTHLKCRDETRSVHESSATCGCSILRISSMGADGC
jgi:hypothetical protein